MAGDVAEPVTPVAPATTWFADDRGTDRRLKVTWRPEHRLIVLSVWRGGVCTATVRLPLAEAPRLIASLVEALGHAARPGTTRRSRRRC